MSSYNRTLPDELNWSQIDQLHNARLGFSKQSFEIKKICLTLEVASLTLIAKFINNDLDSSLFIAGLIIPVIFYLLDSMTYYYQDSLRSLMIVEENLIRQRHNEPLKKDSRTSCRFGRSLFNSSQILYLILIILDLALGFGLDIFKNIL